MNFAKKIKMVFLYSLKHLILIMFIGVITSLLSSVSLFSVGYTYQSEEYITILKYLCGAMIGLYLIAFLFEYIGYVDDDKKLLNLEESYGLDKENLYENI